MSDGLIGKALLDRILFIGGPGDDLPQMRTDVPRFVLTGTPGDLLDEMRSDETREALVDASMRSLQMDPAKALDWERDIHRDVIDAVVRALTGEEAS